MAEQQEKKQKPVEPISRDTFENMKEVFFLFDKDQDGYIEKNELKSVFFALDNNPTDEYMDQVIQSVDQNGDGKLDYNEYVTLLETYLKDPEEEAIGLREAFRILDRERTGRIGKDKLCHLLKGTSPLEIDTLFDQIDSNKDGYVDVEELVNYMCRRATYDIK